MGCAAKPRANRNTAVANARTEIVQTLIAASFRGFTIITDTNFFCGASTKTVIVCTRANRGDGELRLRRPAQRLRQELSFPHPSDVKKKAFWHTRSSSTTVEFPQAFGQNNSSDGRASRDASDLDKSFITGNAQRPVTLVASNHAFPVPFEPQQ